jgi:hypothetical protein
MAFLLVGLVGSSGSRGDEPLLRFQEEQQKQIREETERTARRIATMLQVLNYYQVDQAAQKKLLEEVARTLAGLSQGQMADVIRRLEAAARVQDSTKSEKELEAIYARHREILLILRGLLARYDAVKTLDQVADRLEKMALDQLEHYLQTAEILREAEQRLKEKLPAVPDHVVKNRPRNLGLALRQESDAQTDQRHGLENVLKQAAALKADLPGEQQERLLKLEKEVGELQLLASLAQAADKLQATGYPDQRLLQNRAGNDLQWKTAADLQKLAGILRTSPDKLAALKEARDRLDRAVAQQQAVGQDTKNQTSNPSDGPKTARELADQQARLAFETGAVQQLLQPHTRELSQKLLPAASGMKEAEKALRQQEAAKAVSPQQQAHAKLQDVRDRLQEMLAQAEPPKKEPSGALANAAQQLAQALQQTKQAAQLSQQAAQAAPATPQPPNLAELQQQVADQASKMSLQEATPPAQKAADALKGGELSKAIPQQQQALAKLQNAAAQQPATGQPQASQPPVGQAKSPMGAPGNQPMAQSKPAPQPLAGQAKPNQSQPGQAKGGSPQQGQTKTGQASPAPAKAGQTQPAQAKSGQVPSTQAKSGQPQAGQSKTGQAQAGQSKSGQKSGQGQAKAGQPQPGGTPSPASAQNAAQLAQAQKALLAATQALAKSQQATQAAMASLGQAQAQAPQAVQPQLQQAGQQLGQASNQLAQGSPVSAGQSQAQAAAQMQSALQAMNNALAAQGSSSTPAQAATAMAGQGQGQTQGQGQGQGQVQGQGQQPSPGAEKNEGQGSGNRVADGKVSHGASRLTDAGGAGSFLHLAPRQRELLRQAITDRLPPEYAGLIQQYYLNIARGRPAAIPVAAPPR